MKFRSSRAAPKSLPEQYLKVELGSLLSKVGYQRLQSTSFIFTRTIVACEVLYDRGWRKNRKVPLTALLFFRILPIGCHDRKVAPPKHILWGYEHIVGLGVHRQLKALSVSDGAF